jgi:hypothetical protein
MKRLLGISLLVLYINSYTELHEALRLPVLLEHYAEHRQQVKDMSFLEFLSMHYKTDQAHDANDNRLPFKDRGHCFAASVMALPLHKIVLKETTPLTKINHASKYNEVTFSSHLSDIFQPPRHT